jgi:signal transduction histidine kinase
LVLSGLLAFAVVSTGAVIVARSIAQDTALAEAERSTRALGNALFAPALPAVIAGDQVARHQLDQAVDSRSRDGSIVRVKVWGPDGTILYSGKNEVIGTRFPSRVAEVNDVIANGTSTAAMSDLNDPDNQTETAAGLRLVEVYTPLTLQDGRKLAFEIYFSDARVTAAKDQLTAQLVPFALLALLVLVLAQLPVSVWLVRRVSAAQEERGRLLQSALTASDRERKAIARDLHDGVVQDLAGAGYALGGLSSTLPADAPDRTRTTVRTVAAVVRDAVGSLRTLMVDIYPPDLTSEGLPDALKDLGSPLVDGGVEFSVRANVTGELTPGVTTAVYRCAREGLANVAKHARAEHVTVTLEGGGKSVRLRVEDDGVGLPPEGVERRLDGHMGLHLLRDLVEDLGGRLILSDRPGGGTAVVADLPNSNGHGR